MKDFEVIASSSFSNQLERFPLGWNHLNDKNSLQINMLEHVLIAKPHTLLLSRMPYCRSGRRFFRFRFRIDGLLTFKMAAETIAHG